MSGFGSGTRGKAKLGVANLRHGGYSFLRTGNTPPCRICLIGKQGQCSKYQPEADRCEVALEAMDGMIGKILKSCPWITPVDMPTLEVYVRNWIFLFVVDKWLSIMGPFRDDAKEHLSAQGILRQRWVCENAMLRAATALGLTPEARKNMGLPLGEEPDLVQLSTIEEKFKTKPPEIEGNGKEKNGPEAKA